MSGHSKWAKLKHSKGALDAKKSAMFTKIGHALTVAARDGGDPTMNFKLRMAIEKAREINMPKENIERSIKRGTGELGGAKPEDIVYEAFGPSGVALVIESLTDNKARTAGSLRRILKKYDGSLAGQNAVLWMFEHRGVIRIMNPPTDGQIANLEDFQLRAIEMGAEDIQEEDDELVIYTKMEDLQKVKEGIEKEGIKIDYAELEWLPKDPVKVEESIQNRIDNLSAELDEDPDISDYYNNIK